MNEEKLQSSLENIYCRFHEDPELSWKEFETTKKIREILGEIPGLTVKEMGTPTGIYAVLNDEKEGPTAAIRADIDALPVEEATGLACTSHNKGVMHACGHDFHMTAAIGAAMRLSEIRDELPGRIVFLFQPAEESGMGAASVIKTGLFEREKIQQIFGMHVEPGVPIGTIALRKGAFSASVDSFKLEIVGKGGHGAHPDQCKDPVPAALRLVSALYEIRTRAMNPAEPGVISITQVHAGSAYNIIPDSVMLGGTVRTFRKQDRELFKHEISLKAKALEAEGFAVNIEWVDCCAASDNDPELIDMIEDICREMNIPTAPWGMSLGGEDFADYQEIIPGGFFQVGSGEDMCSLHNAHFRAPVESLKMASDVIARAARRAILNGRKL